MGLETRGNGLYYYKKRRIGKRVVSEYCGGGEIARYMQILDLQRQEDAWLEKETSKRYFEAEKQSHAETDRAIESLCREAEALKVALYLISGYHKHSRQWRKKRYDGTGKTDEA